MTKKIICVLSFLLMGSLSQALEVGDAAPCVVLENIRANGQSSDHCIRDADVAGQPVVLDFLSIYCHDCLASLPLLNRLSQETAGLATFRGVALDRNEQEVKNFVGAHADVINHEVALDSHRDARKAYGVVSTPTLFVLNKNNIIIYKHEGVVTQQTTAELQNVIKAAQ